MSKVLGRAWTSTLLSARSWRISRIYSVHGSLLEDHSFQCQQLRPKPLAWRCTNSPRHALSQHGLLGRAQKADAEAGGMTGPACPIVALCSRPSTPLRAAKGGGLRPALTAPARGALAEIMPGRRNAAQPNKETSLQLWPHHFAELDAHNSKAEAAERIAGSIFISDLVSPRWPSFGNFYWNIHFPAHCEFRSADDALRAHPLLMEIKSGL